MDQKADELIDYVKDWPKGTSGLVDPRPSPHPNPGPKGTSGLVDCLSR